MNNPEISVLMSVYNGEKYLKEAIKSVLTQTFEDFEFLIINDGSTDKSEDIIESFKDSRIRLINNEKNEGLIFSLNKGLKIAMGKYIARLDCDDISLPQRLEKQYRFLEKNSEISLLGSWAELINENGSKIGTRKELPLDYYSIKFHLFYGNPLMHSSIFFRKEIIGKLEGYDEKYKYAEDYELYTRLVKKYKIINLPEVLIKFRIHNKSIGQVSETKKIQEETCQKIIFNYINYYYKLKWNDFKIFYNVIRNKHPKFRNFLKILLISKKIYKSFIKKEGLDKKELKKIQKLRNELLIRYLVKFIKRNSIFYTLGKFFYFIFFKKRLILNYFFLRYKKDIKLHLGSRNKKIKNYINVDSELLPNVDLVCNIKNLKYFFRKNSISHIYISHTLEHFSHEEVKKVLKLCYDLLCKQGELRLSVPDMDKIVKIYYKNWKHFQTPGNSPWIGLIWGEQLTKYDYHKTGFNFNWMKYLLEQIGFKSIEKYDARFFLEDSESDASLNEAFGELISLNIIAKK